MPPSRGRWSTGWIRGGAACARSAERRARRKGAGAGSSVARSGSSKAAGSCCAAAEIELAARDDHRGAADLDPLDLLRRALHARVKPRGAPDLGALADFDLLTV